jgi:hypothetical protein
MVSTLSDLDICNTALVKLGALPIAGFDDADAAAAVCRTLYPVVVDATLTSHPWSFTLKRATLTALDGAPLADFSRRFALPADFLRAIYVDDRGSSPRYAIIGAELHCESSTVVLTYQYRPPEAAFPPFFRAALIARLAGDLCLPLTESTSRAETLDRLAERELERAWAIDRSQETPPLIGDDTLIRVRG